MTNKEKIKREALFLFAENGYEKTSVREIARKVGIRESAIYNHYKSKYEIFSALVSEAKEKLSTINYADENLLEKLSSPEIFFKELAEKVINDWSNAENKAFTKMLIQAKFNSSVNFDFGFEELFVNLRKLLEIVFNQLVKYRYVKEFPVNFLVDEFISPLIVIKLKFLINDFFDREQVLTYAKSYVSVFWEQVKAG